MFEAGFREWYQTSDARLNGRRLPVKRLLRLFRTGFTTGGMELVLLTLYQRIDADADASVADRPLDADNQHSIVYVGRATTETARRESHGCHHHALLSPASIPQVIGFDAISRWGGMLQGHLLYLKPQYRGQGFCRLYFSAMLDFCREGGFEGFRFLSTLPHWSGVTIRNSMFERRLHLIQKGGVPVYEYSRKVV